MLSVSTVSVDSVTDTRAARPTASIKTDRQGSGATYTPPQPGSESRRQDNASHTVSFKIWDQFIGYIACLGSQD